MNAPHAIGSAEAAASAHMDPIYLDGFSTTPLAPEAGAAMLEAWQHPGNPNSPHVAGERAARAVADARSAVAALIGAAPNEIVFTSGATEANNIALLGVASRESGRRKIIISAIEHKSVLETGSHLASRGYNVVHAPVDRHGRLDLPTFRALVDGDTLLVSLMAANNETGVIQPVKEAVAIAHANGALFHCDAAQAVGKIALDVSDLDIDYLSISAHKMYGPMGIGALFVAASAPALKPISFGGGQQRGLRAGTEPVPLIVGFGEAARIAERDLEADSARCTALAARLLGDLRDHQLRVRAITGDWPILPGSLALQFEGLDAESICLAAARKVSISTGSACTSGQLRSSHVLESMGLSGSEANSVVRLFCGRYLSDDAVRKAVLAIVDAANRMR